MFIQTFKCLLIGCMSLLVVNVAYAASPDSTKPGAVRPKLKIQRPPKINLQRSIDIPAVIDRPFGMDDGPKVLISTIQLRGQVVERPGYGISVQAMQDLVDKELKAYTEGVTMGQMQAIADKLTSYYREHGFILAQAFVPSQKVSSDTIEIKVLEGRLGKVFVENNEYYSLSTLRRALAPLTGEPVVKDEIESAVLELFDLPGLSVSAVFRPGEKEIGTTDLVLKVQDETVFNIVLNADNYGSEFSGVYRPRIDAVLNNPTGNGDVLSASFMHAVDPFLTRFGALSYQFPVFTSFSTHPVTVGLAVSHEQFEVGGNDARDAQIDLLNLDGSTSIASLSFKYPLLKSRVGNVDAHVDMSRKRAVSVQDGIRQSQDDLSVLTAGLSFQHIDLLFGDQRGAGNQGGIFVLQGFTDILGSLDKNDPISSRSGGSLENAGGDFTKVLGNYTRLQNLGWGTALLLRFDGQWSDDLLVSLEQYSMGGPFNVRAYPQSESLVDSAYFGSAEFTVNAPGFKDVPAFWGHRWGDIIQVSTFVDYARGYTNDAINVAERRRTFAGFGFGAKITLPGVLQMNVTTAFPLSKADATNGHDPQTFFSISAQY